MRRPDIKKLFFLLPMFALCNMSYAQTEDEKTLRAIFDEALDHGQSYRMLDYLTNKIGARLSGSPQAAAAVEWSRFEMEKLGFDRVFLQELMVPHWVRGEEEKARIVNSKKWGSIDVNIRALGNSVGTGASGIVAHLVEVKSFEELENLGVENIRGKIVYFSRPMDPKLLNTFSAYGGAVDQRGSGASEAAKYGALGVVVRSMGQNQEDYAHTGGMNYAEGIPKIPAVAISTKDGDFLSELLKDDPELKFYFETHCEMLDEAPSHNVVGEIRGKKDSYIVVGGHLDSWDLGQGAHDDGSGCVQSIEALRILKAIGYQPKNTLRAVMFMNEENGLRGGLKYAELAELGKEKHVFALESDRGGFSPRGFTLEMSDKQREKVKSWTSLLEPYGLTDLDKRGGGADIGPLGRQGVPLAELLPDAQRYFNYHHTEADVFEAVEKRELEMGAAAMACLIYLIDKYGL